MKDILDKKFNHHRWYKEGLTRREAMKRLATSGDIYMTQKPSIKQSDNLYDPTIYDDILTDGYSSYRLSIEEKEYYTNCKEVYSTIKLNIKSSWTKGFDKWEYVEEYTSSIREQYNNSFI